MSNRIGAILRVFGAVTALSSLIILPSLLLAVIWNEPTVLPFLEAMLPTLAVGALLWYAFRHSHFELRLRDGFLITAGIWIIASLITAVPFFLALPALSYTDAVFEATSGLTTTGATVLTDAAAARLVLNHHLRIARQVVSHVAGQQPCAEVVIAAGRKWHDHIDRLALVEIFNRIRMRGKRRK